MSNNELEKIDHTLSAINEIGSKTDDLLEKRKNEQVMAAGGAVAAKELKELHEKFMAKSRESLTEDVKSGKIPESVGNYVMSWLRQSDDVVRKFLTDKTAQMNAKIGEVIAMEGSVKLLKAYYDAYAVKKEHEQERLRQEELSSAKNEDVEKATEDQPKEQLPVSFADLVPTEVPKLPQKKGRPGKQRPDEVGPLAKTVKRIKENRKNRQQNN